jgi:hypothetical protein
VTGSSGSFGIPSTPLPISDAEAFERLAAVLWDQKPDTEIVASSGRLATTADVREVVKIMLADPRAAVGVGAFYRWWLGLDDVAKLKKDPMLFPEFTPELQADMVDETITFGVQTTLAEHASFQTLMLASFSFVNARLASLYGVTGITSDFLQRADLPVGRAGLLTQPALQALGSFAARNSPSHRGTYIGQRFLCEAIPSAPPGVQPLDPVPPGETVRQALQASITSSSPCAACHAFVDPPGLAFEGFDAIGRARTTDNGLPVDTSNLVVMLWSPNAATNSPGVRVNGPVELAKMLATAAATENCFAQKWLSFALGREVGPGDMASLATIQATFAASGFDLQELIASVLSSDTFLAPP